MKWRKISEILSDKSIPLRQTGKIYKTVAKKNDIVCWTVNRKVEQI